MIDVGSTVRVLPPFAEFWPGDWEVVAQSETGAWQIDGGVDFDEAYLEEVTE